MSNDRDYDNLVLTVGKHKYDTFADVYEHDEGYCNWVLNEGEFDNDSLDAFYHYVLLRSYSESLSPQHNYIRGGNTTTTTTKGKSINISINV